MGDTKGRGNRYHSWPFTVGLSLLVLILLLPRLSLADPSIEATLSDTPSMNPVGPGETIDYEALLSNSGDMPATGVTLSDQSGGNNTSFTPASLRTTPLCLDDSFSTPANTPLDTSPASVLDNDTDPDGTGVVCITSGGSCIGAPLGLTSTQGANVTLNVDGSFSYTPPPGFSGTDTFTYPINDSEGNDCLDDLGAPTTATVSIAVLGPSTGTILIVTDTLPDGGQDFSFTAPGLSPATFTLDDDSDGTLTNAQMFSNVVPGSYTVTETAVPGFLQSVSCTDPDTGTTTTSNSATIDLDAGETVTCTFVNTQQGTLTIIKDSVPNAAQDFAFTATGGVTPASFSLDDDADATLSTTQTFSNVNPGSYTVTETAVPGFDTTISCSDPDTGTTTAGNTATIDFDAGETITCTFTNTQRGTIIIVTDTLPDNGQDFSFSDDIAAPNRFVLDDDGGLDATWSNTATFTNVVPGSYTVTETPVAGFLPSVSCTDPDTGTTTTTDTASIDLDAGETITCTFLNTQQGTLAILKDTVPDNGQDFAFSTTGGLLPMAFTLDDDPDATLSNAQTFMNVNPGSYSVTETAVPGFDTTLSCIDPDNGTTIAGSTATIDFDPGETITCTFTNTQQGTIEIITDTVPDSGQDFAFTATGGLSPATFTLDDDADGTLANTQTFSNVSAGSYTISETAVPGFTTMLSCIDPDSGTTTAGPMATIDLDPGETVTCTYTNTQHGSITILTDTVPDNGQDFAFTTTGGLSPAGFSLDDDSDATLPNTQTFSNVVPGSYTVTETTPPSSFFLSSLSCSDPSGGTTTASPTATIALAAGETVTCTFENTATVAPSATDDPNGGLPATSTPSNDGTVAGTDNAYHTALNTLLTVPDGAGDLLANDTLGTPTAAMSSFGPTLAAVTMFAPDSGTQANATAQGGSLAVNADGSFVYTPPSATFTGLDSFAYRLTNVAGTSDAMVTIGVGLRPSAVNDTVTTGATGNVAMQSDRLNVQLNGLTGQSLISNDLGDQISVTAISASSTNSGNVSSVAGNHFRYNPPPGFEGTDTFTYTIDNGFSQPAMGTVSIDVSGMIWFIDNTAGAAGDGRLSNPFQELAGAGNSFDGNAADEAGDNIFIERNVATAYTGGLTLLNNQRLIGDGSSSDLATLTGLTLAPGSDPLPTFGGTDPIIATTNANAITLAQGNTIRGLTIGNTGTGTGVLGNTVGPLTVSESSIMGTGQAVDINTGSLAVSFDSLSSTSSTTAVNLTGVSGTFTAPVGAISGATGTAFQVTGGNPTVTYGGTITNTAGRMIRVANTTGNAVTFNTATANGLTDSGTGIEIEDNDGSVTINNADLNGTGGVLLEDNNTGNVTINTTTIDITGANDAFFVNGNTADVSSTIDLNNVDITNPGGRLVRIEDMNGGSVDFDAASALSTTTGTGILVDSNTNGTTVTFNSTTKTLNTGSNAAVTLTNNTGTTITFTGGNLDIDTTSGTGFNATGGGTVTVQGTNNSVNTTRTAVNITDTTIGAGNVTFRNISANAGNTATTAIILDDTGTGTFSVTGDGTTSPVGTQGGNGSGGTIENVRDADAITLNNTDGRVTFQNMIIQDIRDTDDTTDPIQTRSGRDAIHGADVDGGLTIESSIIRRTSDNGIHGRAFTGGPGTNFNGLEVLNSLLENAGRFHVANVGDDGAQEEGLVTILGMTGTVRVDNSQFTLGGHALSLVSPSGLGTLDMTVQRSIFVDLYKEFGCQGAVPTINVGERGITVQVEGSHDAVVRIGDPAEASAALGNTFTNNSTASIVVNGQEGGATPHTGNIDVVISRNTFAVTDHLTGPAGCPAGQFATTGFNFPQGGVSLNPAGGTYEAIVSNNLFDQVMHAAGGFGQLTIGTLTGNGDSEFIVRGNEFRLPWDAAVVLRAEANNSAAILFDGNIYTDGVVGGASDDVGASTQSPFQGFLVNVRNNGSLDLTVQNEILPQQDDVNGGGDFTFVAETQNQSGNTLNLYIDNTRSPDGYRFIQTNGTFNLFRENMADTTAATIMDGNGNTGGNGMSGVPNPAVNGDNTDPPVVSTTGTITPTDTAPTLPTITIP